MNYGTVGVVLAVVFLFGRVYLPWTGTAAGVLVRRQHPPLLAKLRMHAVPAVVVLAGAGLGTLTGVVRPESFAGLVAAVAVLVSLPLRYTITTEGIQQGRTRFRRWTEFAGVARRPGGARLQGIAGARGKTVWLAGSRDIDETLLLLRQLVRGSYKGEIELPAGKPADNNAPSVALDRTGGSEDIAGARAIDDGIAWETPHRIGGEAT